MRTTQEPHDRLTNLCASMTRHLPDDVRAIVMLDDGKMGGIQVHGYEDMTEALTDLLVHLRAMLKSRGQDMIVIPLNHGEN